MVQWLRTALQCREQPFHPWSRKIPHGSQQLSPSVQLVTQPYPTLCDPMDCSRPGLSVPHHLLKFAQVHVTCIGGAIQPSHPLMPSSPVLHLSQHQGLFQQVSCSHWKTEILEFQLSISPSNEYSGLIPLKVDGLISLLSRGLSGVFSSTTVQRHQFFTAPPS